ncbi:hypothetical protein NDU88_000256, partial [Pleurodeles waltl]
KRQSGPGTVRKQGSDSRVVGLSQLAEPSARPCVLPIFKQTFTPDLVHAIGA